MKRASPIAALVPVRGLALGKQRLATLLAAPERRALVQAMLEDVLDVLRRSPSIALLAVVSGDPEVADLAKRYAALPQQEAPEGGLNASLQRAASWLAAAHPDHATLVVAADLPALTPALLEATVLASDAETVIARSVDGGTNLLLQQPPAIQQFEFGPASCAKHQAAALAQGRSVQVLDHPALAQDFDVPDDLPALLSLGLTRRTLALLRRLGRRNLGSGQNSRPFRAAG